MDTLDFSQQTEDLIDVDDKVVVSEISMAMLWTLREQAITRIEFFFDRDQALEAAGVRE
jgi:ketosteroid isomerase-like protein